MKTRTYFYTTQIKSGEWVNLVYDSKFRKGTAPHWDDFYKAAYGKVELIGMYPNEEEMRMNAYILNDKNKEEQCFDDYKTIDLR